MHKRENLAKFLARQESKTGWNNPFAKMKHEMLAELNQLHMSKGLGHHLARMMGSRNWQHMRGRA